MTSRTPITGFHCRDIETMPRPALEALQLARLRSTVTQLRDRVPFMADRLAGSDDPGSLDELAMFPFLHKADLRQNYPFGLCAVPRHELARVHASSGTTGKPTVVGYTRADLAVWAECVARCLRGAGAEPGDLMHNAYGYGLFTGGLGLHAGAEAAGIGVVPVSGGNTERQLLLIDDFAPDILCCTPSYALTLAEALGDTGPASSLRIGLHGAEPWSSATRDAIESGLGTIALNIYGLSEVIGPGVACETTDRNGLVIMEDHFLPEIVDPDTGERLPDGEIGVLVLTSLTKQAFPVLRFWTGDLCSLTHEPSPCGRTHARMSFVVGRSDDMLVIRGVNVYPSEVEHTLLAVDGVGPHFQLVVERQGTLDTLHIRIERGGAAAHSPSASSDEELASLIVDAMRSALLLGVRVTIEAPGTVPRSEGGKLNHTIDTRKL